MSAANASRAHASAAPPASLDPLFKEDRPRRIDRFISFFGDDDAADRGTESSEGWSER